MSELVEMRGFKFSGDPVYPETGFKTFECLDCRKDIIIQGKRVFHTPLRLVTFGFCRTPGCRMQNNQIPSRIEYLNEKTLMVEEIVREVE